MADVQNHLPEPYYDHGGIKIYNASAWDVLPHLEPVEALITDPPYGCKMPSQRTGRREDIKGNERVDTSWISMVNIEDGGAAYVFTCWEVMEQWRKALASSWAVRSCIVWDKAIHGLGDLKGGWAPRHELCLFASNGRHVLKGKRPADVIMCQRTNDTSHPYEKPVLLLRRIIDASRPRSVLDPFMGSGTTLLAAKMEGCRGVGVEIEERYCELAANRLSQGVLF